PATRRALDACLEATPGSLDCLKLAISLDTNDGECKRAENESRRYIAAYPDSPDGYMFLAQSLAGLGASVAQLHATLEQRWVRARALRPFRECRDQGLLTAMQGDFARTEETLAACDKVLSSEVDPYLRGQVRWIRAMIQLELGARGRAVDLAHSYVAESAAW